MAEYPSFKENIAKLMKDPIGEIKRTFAAPTKRETFTDSSGQQHDRSAEGIATAKQADKARSDAEAARISAELQARLARMAGNRQRQADATTRGVDISRDGSANVSMEQRRAIESKIQQLQGEITYYRQQAEASRRSQDNFGRDKLTYQENTAEDSAKSFEQTIRRKEAEIAELQRNLKKPA